MRFSRFDAASTAPAATAATPIAVTGISLSPVYGNVAIGPFACTVPTVAGGDVGRGGRWVGGRLPICAAWLAPATLTDRTIGRAQIGALIARTPNLRRVSPVTPGRREP